MASTGASISVNCCGLVGYDAGLVKDRRSELGSSETDISNRQDNLLTSTVTLLAFTQLR